jgi:two-component system, chemotaxis family, sensor kinase CheA
MDDLLVEFLTETNESIEVVDNELVRLEQNPNDKKVLDNIFRLVHTIKGTCGFLGLPRLEAVAHSGENVLGKFRDGVLVVTPGLVTLILESLDCIKVILRALEQTGTEPEGDDSDLIGRLDEAAEGKFVDSALAEAAPEPEVVARNSTEQQLGRALKPGEVSLEELEAAFANASGPESEEPEAAAPVAAEQVKAKKTPVAKAPAAAAEPGAEDGSGKGGQSIRVSVDLLEDLMNLVSELVLTRNQLVQIGRRHENSEFTAPLQRLSQCTTELQEGVMKTRMQPIGNAWAKLPRIVRDLSMELGKKLDLQMKGAETELDRQVLELIKDPLTHMVRNSADHGVEMPDERVKAGKPELGTIKLNAFHEGGNIIIQIADDGKGIGTERLARNAIESGLITENELAAMSESQIQKLIFHAGLSTAEKVTSVSGRGVGMDVVRSNIEKIGGTIDLQSTPGRGTTFSIKIPLTLAIVSALIVEVDGERFAVPQMSVLELVRAGNASEHKIELINATPVLRLRNRLLPLVYLNDMLGLPRPEENREKFVIVTQVGSANFGVVVDRVFDTEEIVVKPVSPILQDLSIYSGNTILGDGSVIMIIDPNGVANEMLNAMQGDEEDSTLVVAANDSSEREAMLMFRAGDATPKAVPLSLIARLEDFEADRIEWSEGRPMVQYRGSLMPLVLIDPELTLVSEGRQPVLVFVDGDKTLGIAVDQIMDIVDEELDIEMNAERLGRIGTAVIAGKVSEVIDIAHYFNLSFKNYLRGSTGVGDMEKKRKSSGTVLLIDDSSFFRTMLKPLLTGAGYTVTAVADAEAALKLRETGATFDLILSDIEMPGLNGFEFAEVVRSGGSWSEVPMVALSSLSEPAHFERGRDAGFNDYVAKHDRASLIAVLEEQLASAKAA